MLGTTKRNQSEMLFLVICLFFGNCDQSAIEVRCVFRFFFALLGKCNRSGTGILVLGSFFNK